MTDQAHSDSTVVGPAVVPKLQVLRGDSPGKSYTLKFKTRLGRETDNDIVIVDPRISRYHVQISFENGQWLLSDLGSVNGTQINGITVSVSQALSHGDQITLGETVLVYRDPTLEKDIPFDPSSTVHGRTGAPPIGTQSAVSNKRMAWIAGGLILILLLAVAGILIWFNREPEVEGEAQPVPTTTQGFTILRTTPKPEANLTLKYEDDFSDSFGGWDDAFGKGYTKQYGNNEYHIELTTNNLVVWGLANRIAADFEVEVETTKEDGGNANTYGLIFRYVNHNNYYRFDISGEGFFLLSKFQDGTWHTLADWEASPAINQGQQTINVLKVSASGPEIAIFANGEELARVTDDAFSEGNFGFFASTFDNNQMWVSFDNLKLWAPADQEIVQITASPAPQTPTPAVVAVREDPTATLAPPAPTPTATSLATSAEPANSVDSVEGETSEVKETTTSEAETPAVTETSTAIAPQEEETATAEPENIEGTEEIEEIKTPETDETETGETDETGEPETSQEPASVITNTATIEAPLETPPETPVDDIITSPEAAPTPVPLPDFVSRDQPLARGEAVLPGKIYFPIYDPGRGTYDIFRANTNGTEQELIQAEASQVTLNSSGEFIAYRSWRADQRGLLTRALNETDYWRFVQFFEAASPVYSADDQFFIFHSRQGGEIPAIYRTVGADHEVLRREGIPIQGEMAALTPDNRVIYRGCMGNTCGLVISNLDGGFPQQLTDQADDTAPAVSPDGQTIAFMSNRDGNWEIYTISVDGQNLQRLTNAAGNDGLPFWSPNESLLGFATNRDGPWALWAMQPNGEQKRQLFALPGSVDGIIQIDIQNSFGWLEERIVWKP